MIIETVQVNGTWLAEVTYNNNTNDMLLTYLDGKSNRYVDVPVSIFKNIKELQVDKIAPEEIESYVEKAMTKTKRGAYVGRGIYMPKLEDKYIRVKMSEPDEEAQNLTVEYALKTSSKFTVEEKYSSSVEEISYNDNILSIKFRKTDEPYRYEDRPNTIKSFFNKFVDHYLKVKADPKKREKYSLGLLANVLNKKYPKKAK